MSHLGISSSLRQLAARPKSRRFPLSFSSRIPSSNALPPQRLGSAMRYTPVGGSAYPLIGRALKWKESAIMILLNTE
jgi:hypothetical protein